MYEHIQNYMAKHPTYVMKWRVNTDHAIKFIVEIKDPDWGCRLQLVDYDLDVLLGRVNETLGCSPYNK